MLYLATTGQYYCTIAVAFHEAHVSVRTYRLFASYVYTSQRIRLCATCTLRIVCSLPPHPPRISARRFAVKSTLILQAATSVSGYAPALFVRKLKVAVGCQLRPAHFDFYTFSTSVHRLQIKNWKCFTIYRIQYMHIASSCPIRSVKQFPFIYSP